MSKPLSDEWWRRVSAFLVRLKKVGARLRESETDLDVEIERRLAMHKVADDRGREERGA